ncbi:MAG: hypothetical protein AAB284_03345, partial [Chloroflexota bacterium]
RQYRRPFDHDEAWLARCAERQRRLEDRLGRGPLGPIGRDAATRAVIAALDDDLDTAGAIRALERVSRTADDHAKASLRWIAHQVLGIVR